MSAPAALLDVLAELAQAMHDTADAISQPHPVLDDETEEEPYPQRRRRDHRVRLREQEH